VSSETEQQVGPVDLTVPASSEHLRILRLVAASLAASLGLDVDQLDDLRIAVDELSSLLIEHAPPGCRLRLTLCSEGGSLVAEGGLTEDAPIAAIDSVSQLILDGLDVEWSCAAPSAAFRLVAPRRPLSDGT
jgi:serine/threonine-protein kinase RsbW